MYIENLNNHVNLWTHNDVYVLFPSGFDCSIFAAEKKKTIVYGLQTRYRTVSLVPKVVCFNCHDDSSLQIY